MTKCDILCQVFGYVGGGLSAFMFLPQLVKIHRTKKVNDISWITLLMANTSSTFILLYTIQIKSTALVITSSISILIRSIVMVYKFFLDEQ